MRMMMERMVSWGQWRDLGRLMNELGTNRHSEGSSYTIMQILMTLVQSVCSDSESQKMCTISSSGLFILRSNDLSYLNYSYHQTMFT